MIHEMLDLITINKKVLFFERKAILQPKKVFFYGFVMAECNQKNTDQGKKIASKLLWKEKRGFYVVCRLHVSLNFPP